jgi:hypothetical protein
MPELKEEDYKIKGSKDLWECVKSLEAIAHWMQNSSFDYELKDLKYLFKDVLRTYSNYLHEKTNI